MHRPRIPTVSWLELLQDLVMVVLAITLFSGLQYGWGTQWAIWYAAAILVAYGSWVSWVFLNNRFPSQGLLAQATTVVWIFGAVLASGGSLWENWLSTTTLNIGLALSFAALSARHATIAMTHPDARTPSLAAASLSGAATIVLLLGAAEIFPEYLAMGIGPLVALVGLLVVYPRLLPKTIVVNVAHLSERFGQFVLILIGDGLLEIILNAERGGTTTVLAIAEAVAVAYLLWRAYFIYVLPAGPPPSMSRLQGWVSAHLVVVVGLGLTSATIAAEAVPLDDELLSHMEAFTRAVGVGLTLALVYVGLALTLLASGGRSRRVAVPFFAIAVILIVAHYVAPGIINLVTGLLVVIVMCLVDFAAHRLRRRKSGATTTAEDATPAA